jgi:hypothetical protein
VKPFIRHSEKARSADPSYRLAMMMPIMALLIISISSLLTCKVGLVIYSVTLTIILPISSLMLYLAQDIEDGEIEKSFGIFAKISSFGFLLIIASIIAAKDEDAIINNYLPILNNLTFIGGLSIFLASSLLACLTAGSNTIRIIYGIAAASLVFSYRKIDREITYPIDLHGYFEMLFLTPASSISILSMFLAYLIIKKLLDASDSNFVESTYYGVVLYIFKYHFLEAIDSAKFFSLSSTGIHTPKAVLISFILIGVVKHLRPCKQLGIISLLAMVICIFSDAYNANQGSGVEYFNLAHNYGTIISVMCYLTYILFDKKSYLMKYAKSQVIIYFLSTILIISNIAAKTAQVSVSITGILFAIICIINMIENQRKLGKK